MSSPAWSNATGAFLPPNDTVCATAFRGARTERFVVPTDSWPIGQYVVRIEQIIYDGEDGHSPYMAGMWTCISPPFKSA